MATKIEANPKQPSSPIRPPTPHPKHTHPQNPYEHRPLPLPPKCHTAVIQDLNLRSIKPKHRCRWILYCSLIFLVLFFAVLLFSVLVTKQATPKITIQHLKINGFKNVADAIVLSTNINVQMKIFNPSKHIGVIYEADNSVIVRYAGARLGTGGFPTFYLSEKNSTHLDVPLAASGLVLSRDDREAIVKDQKKKDIPLTLEIRSAIRFKVGNVKTMATSLRALCKLKVNDLVPQSVLISSSSKYCRSSLELWVTY